MPNGKIHDNPLSDLTIHGVSRFPRDIEQTLRRIEALGERIGRWPLGEHWPYSPREFEWAEGRALAEARQWLATLEHMLANGRADEILLNPRTGKPIATSDARESM